MVRLAIIFLSLTALSAAPAHQPVILELFTSQGCSSCPPADALLVKLSKDPRVIPLAFHVDYWNHLGWQDPFSKREWSLRQGEYVRAMELEGAYTPQLVVNGTRQVVGSNAAAVYKAIEEESRRRPKGLVAQLAIQSKLGVVAFLQERGTRRIVSAGRLQPVRLY